ncbi:DNA helicase rad5, partial [Clydaea vesicula]
DLEIAINLYLNPPITLSKTQDFKKIQVKNISQVETSAKSQPGNATLNFPIFIGDLISNATSLLKGTDFARDGDKCFLERDGLKNSKNSTNLSEMKKKKEIKKKPEKISKIVRIVLYKNKRRIELGALGHELAQMIGILIDYKICQFECNIISIPAILNIHTDFLINIKVLLNQIKVCSDEQENEVEARLQKITLFKLFNRVGLKQKNSNSIIMNEEKLIEVTSADSVIESESSENVNEDDLKSIFSKRSTINITPKEAKPGFAFKLRDYQKVALGFMYSKEQKEYMETSQMDPFWNEYCIPDTSSTFFFSPYSGKLQLQEPVKDCVRGGILADEMVCKHPDGLGKTVEILALIHSNQYDPKIHILPEEEESSFLHRSKIVKLNSSSTMKHYFQQNTKKFTSSTLVICPLNLLSQWKSEAVKCLGNAREIEIYYGDSKSATWLQKNPPVIVLSTFHTLASKSSNLLSQTCWWRIVLDEAHYIKEKSTKIAKAVFEMKAINKWAVTGTPILNSTSDLYSLIKFLQIKPWNNFSIWKNFIDEPFKKKEVQGFQLLQSILGSILIRRTKSQRDSDGKLIVELPEKVIEILYLKFCDEHSMIYNRLMELSKKKLNTLKNKNNIYTHVFQLILRLRQFCDHPLLLKNFDFDEMLKLDNEVDVFNIKSLSQEEKSPFCKLLCGERAVVSLNCCEHTFCEACIKEHFDKKERQCAGSDCPICMRPCLEEDLTFLNIGTVDGNDEPLSIQKTNFNVNGVKIDAILDIVQKLKQENRKFTIDTENNFQKVHKCVIFSQFTSFLDIIEKKLKNENFKLARLDGSMNNNVRDANLAVFNEDKNCYILLASLRSAGVGLNLVAASTVILCDPWWNSAVEYQAIDRVHRIGQSRDVKVFRLICKDTMEEKMLKIQDRKSMLAGELMGDENGPGVNLNELLAMFD